MNKCPKCGTEYEGKFCPNCGEAWQEEKVCPNCGAKLGGTARFCNNCGYAFYQYPVPVQTVSRPLHVSANVKRICLRVAQVMPPVLFLLFAVFTFVFFALPVVEVTSNIFGTVQNIGNAYQAKSLTDVPQISTPLWLYYDIVVPLGIVLAIVVLVMLFKMVTREEPKQKDLQEQVGKSAVVMYSEKKITTLSVLFEIYYLIAIGFFSYLIATIKDSDGGFGLLKPGACPVLMVVFPVILFVVTLVCMIAEKILIKLPTESDVARENQSAAVAGPRPVNSSRPVRPKMNKKKIIAIVSAALILVLALSIGIPVGIAHRHDGTYYAYDYTTEEYDYSHYMKLNGKKLSDETGATVEVTFDGDNFNVYADLFGTQVAAMTGAVKSGVMKISAVGIDTYVKKNHRHSYGGWETVIEPTCVRDGITQHSCLCGHTKTKPIAKTGEHTYENGICTVCGKGLIFEAVEGGYAVVGFNGDNINELIIPDTYNGLPVISIYSDDISQGIFYDCDDLKRITIPNSVTLIGRYAFSGCRTLKEIHFNGTIDEWQTIEKKFSWDYDTGDYTIICTNGTVDRDGTVHRN